MSSDREDPPPPPLDEGESPEKEVKEPVVGEGETDDSHSHKHHKHHHKHHKSKHHKSKHRRTHSRKEEAAAEEAAKATLFERPPPQRRLDRAMSQQPLTKSTSLAFLFASLKPHSRSSSMSSEIVEPTPVLHHSESTAFSEVLTEDPPEQDGERVGPHSAHAHKRQKTFQVNAVGEVVYKKHPSWVLMHQMQIGIYHSLAFTVPRLVENAIKSGLLKKRPERVMEKDPCITNHAFYDTPEILRFPASGSVLHSTPPHKLGDFKFKDYCPLAFRWIRSFFGITS